MPRLPYACLLLVLTASCVSSDGGSTRQSENPWLDPTPGLRDEIEEQAQRLPWLRGTERVELIQWFAGVGEPAYPRLLELTQDERPNVAGAAFAALGSTGDERLVEYLHELPIPEQEPFELTLERARALLRLGDWSSSVPILIDGLESESGWTRAVCARTLLETTNETHGFAPRAEPAVREASVQRWRAWWSEQESDPMRRAR